MRILPVITRELRAQARQPFTHWLRVVGLVAMIGVVGTFVSEHGMTPGDGGQLFAFLNATLCIAIWILVPLSSADCISRERREGTLGLLFLSPLKPRDIVFAKGLAYGVRVLTLWLASLPVLIIPSLLGGVTWRDAVFSCAVNLGCLALSLGASVLASSFCRTWHRSVVLTILMAVLLVTIFGVLLFLGLFVAIAFFNPAFVWREFWDNTPGIGSLIVQVVMFMVGGAANLSQWLSRMPLVAQNAAVVAFGCFTLLSGLTAFGMLLLAARNVRHSWREEPPSARMKEFERMFLKPVVWVGFFKRWIQRKLDKNPIGWLEQRSWSGRMISLAWFTVVVVVYSMVLGDRSFMRNSGDMQSLLAWLLVATIAATSAASFRRERENGVLELLLVSPLKAREIVQGRLRGLWGQFLPACAAMLGIWVYMISIFGRSYGMGGGSLLKVWFFAVTFMAIPVVGLYFSVQCRHFISAYLLTLAVAVIVPVLLVGIACKWVVTPESIYNEYGEMWRGIYSGSQFVQGGIVMFLLPRLVRKLNERSFPLERTI